MGAPHGPPSSTRAPGAAARTRQAILAATRDVLVDAGYQRFSIDQVADRAGVTRVTVYRHFGAKHKLLDALTADLSHRSQVPDGMDAAAQEPDPLHGFARMIDELCRLWATDPVLLRRLVGLAAIDPEASTLIATREEWRYTQLQRFTAPRRPRPAPRSVQR